MGQSDVLTPQWATPTLLNELGLLVRVEFSRFTSILTRRRTREESATGYRAG
jgi:hypothetical protein